MTAVASVITLCCGATATGQNVLALPVSRGEIALPAEVVDNLTQVAPVVLEPVPFTLTWRSPNQETAGISLDLTFTLGPSVVNGAKQTTQVAVSGKLSVVGTNSREQWAVTQENFRRFSPYVDYTPETQKVVFLLPIAFNRFQASGGDAVHALLLIPCRLHGRDLSCDSPRAAFHELVQRQFPGQRKLDEVLPFRSQPAVQSPTNSAGQPARPGTACCFYDSGITGLCFMMCLQQCPLPPCTNTCIECFPNECVNCVELSCSSCD